MTDRFFIYEHSLSLICDKSVIKLSSVCEIPKSMQIRPQIGPIAQGKAAAFLTKAAAPFSFSIIFTDSEALSVQNRSEQSRRE